MNKSNIYFAQIHPGGRSNKTAMGYIPNNYEIFANFIPTKLDHEYDKGNTYRLYTNTTLPEGTFVVWENNYGSHYTFEEFYTDMDILGFEVVHLPLCFAGGNNGQHAMIKYVEENYIE